MFMSKRRRIGPRYKLKVIKYPKSTKVRRTNMVSRKKAASYGLFYDMMKKYMGAQAMGKPSVAQKTMSIVNRRKNLSIGRKMMSIKGFRVSRFCLMSMRFDMGVGPNDYDNANYLFAGIGLPFFTQYRNWPNAAYNFAIGSNFQTTQWLPGVQVYTRFYVIHPTWPGSKMCDFKNEPQGTNLTGEAQWGLLSGNQVETNNNYNWNTKAVDDVKAIINSTAMPNDNLDILYRSITVYQTTLTIELFNQMQREMDVHFVHFRVLDFDTSDYNNVCGAPTNYSLLLNQLMSAETMGTTEFLRAQNNAAINWEYCIQHKKLPSKNFVTKSWKTVTLGRVIDPYYKVSEVGTVVTRNMQVAVTPRPYRKVTFKYGMKKWTRSNCNAEGSFFPNSILTERQKRDTQLMIFVTENKNYSIDSFTSAEPTEAKYETTNEQVMYRMWKTNIWRESN